MNDLPADLSSRPARYDGARRPENLPDRAIVMTNSERKLLACPRRYLLEVIGGLGSPGTGASRLGDAFHYAKECGVYPSWLEDRPPPRAEFEAGIEAAVRRLLSAAGEEWREKAEEDAVRLRSVLEAWWFVTDGARPPTGYRLIGAEIALAMPIRVPGSSTAYTPETRLVEDPSGTWRIAGAGEPADLTVRWPYWLAGKIDALYAHRRTGALYVSDDKTSSSPAERLRAVLTDSQVPSYLALVRHAVREGLLPGVARDARVVGFWHRIVSSLGYREPAVLKSGALSRDVRARVLSRDYEQALRDRGLDVTDYEPYLRLLRERVDAGVELHEHTDYSDEELDLHEAELYGSARTAASLWRSASRARTAADLAATHPRVPICQAPGSRCPVAGPCVRDGVEARANFSAQPWQVWTTASPKLPLGEAPTSSDPDLAALAGF